MDACVAQAEPIPKARTESLPRTLTGVNWVQTAFVATIVIGILWRGVRYFGQFPIWGDEAMLLLNILDRDYVGLMHHLRYNQVAPLLFLWSEKTVLLMLGPAEWSVHLLPMLAGFAALFVFWRMCRTALAPVTANLAVAILAVSYYPIRHASEVKPYALDLCAAVVLAWLTLEHLRHPLQKRWLMALCAVTPVAVFSSYTSVFVGGAASLVLLVAMRSATWPQRGLYVLFNVLLVASFLTHYGLTGQDVETSGAADKTQAFLHNYWKDAFPPDHPGDWPIWLLQVFTGNMLAYPLGANHGGSTVTFLLVLAGSMTLWRWGQRSLLALCWLPFGFNLIAAVLGKYPFGDSARITLHLAPFICILMAYGAAAGLEHIRSLRWRTGLHVTCFVLLIACGLAGLLRDLMKPYKTEHDRDVRLFVRELVRDAHDEPVLMCHQKGVGLVAELTWNLCTAVPSLHWQTDASSCLASASSCWLVRCTHHDPTIAEMMSFLGPERDDWTVVESDMRMIPPENAKMLQVYCRRVHIKPGKR